jgi:hypothetical protein
MEASLGTSAFSQPSRSAEMMSARSAGSAGTSDLARRHKRDTHFAWLLIGVWVVNCFDLQLTLLAAQQRMLWELNPVVGHLLPFGPKALTCYKFALLAMGSLILWRYRSYRIAAAALWVVAISCVVLSLVWYQLYFGPETAWGGLDTASMVSAPPA